MNSVTMKFEFCTIIFQNKDILLNEHKKITNVNIYGGAGGSILYLPLLMLVYSAVWYSILLYGTFSYCIILYRIVLS